MSTVYHILIAQLAFYITNTMDKKVTNNILVDNPFKQTLQKVIISANLSVIVADVISVYVT